MSVNVAKVPMKKLMVEVPEKTTRAEKSEKKIEN